MSPRGKARPILPDEVNGRSFVNDGVSSVPVTVLRGDRSSAILAVECELQGGHTAR